MKEYGKLILYLIIAYALLPLFFVATRRKTGKGVSQSRPKILVIPVMRRIGDVICATPVFRAIKKHMPGSFLAVAVGGNVVPLVEHNPRIDAIININDQSFHGWLGRGRFFLRIARERFDYVISLPVNPLHSLIAFFSFAPHRIKTVRAERSFLERATDWWNNSTLVYRDHTFLPAHYLRLLEFLDIRENEIVKEVFPAEEGDEQVRMFFESRAIAPDDIVIGISIAAGNKIKEWGDEKFAEIAQRLQKAYRAKIIFVGVEQNASRIENVMSQCDAGLSFSLVGIPLDVLPSFMKRFNLFIAADTGLVYIAHALGIPLIDIVGPIDWREQPPEDEKSILVKPPPHICPSSFVFKRPGSFAEHKRALDAISPDDVWQAVRKLERFFLGSKKI